MEITVLSSGSKGNATYIKINNSHILIDIGITNTSLTNKLSEINITPNSINYLLITHTHKDHILGLEVFLKRYNPIIISSKNNIKELRVKYNIEKYLIIEDNLYIKGIDITLLQASHDTVDCIGFLLEYEEDSVVYITDTGYINKKVLDIIYNKNIYMIESNYDSNMLLEGNYPHYLKMRIVSDTGHLDNTQTSRYLKKIIGPSTKKVVLLHLSEDNNKEDIAYENVMNMLKKTPYTMEVIIANRYQIKEVVK